MKYSHAEYVLIFKALSDETRLKILEMLYEGELCACKILEQFHITQPTLSYHMKLLTVCGLVRARRDGPWMKYTLDAMRFLEINEFWQHYMKSPESANCID